MTMRHTKSLLVTSCYTTIDTSIAFVVLSKQIELTRPAMMMRRYHNKIQSKQDESDLHCPLRLSRPLAPTKTSDNQRDRHRLPHEQESLRPVIVTVIMNMEYETQTRFDFD